MTGAIDKEANKGKSVAVQTKLAAFGYLLLLLSMMVSSYLTKTTETYALNVVLFSIVSIITLYTINCVVEGTCNLYAWFFAYIIFANAAISLIYLIIVVYANV